MIYETWTHQSFNRTVLSKSSGFAFKEFGAAQLWGHRAMQELDRGSVGGILAGTSNLAPGVIEGQVGIPVKLSAILQKYLWIRRGEGRQDSQDLPETTRPGIICFRSPCTPYQPPPPPHPFW